MKSIETLLHKSLQLVETQHAHLLTTDKEHIYDNKSMMVYLGIKDRYLKRLRDNGLLGYSRHSENSATPNLTSTASSHAATSMTMEKRIM